MIRVEGLRLRLDEPNSRLPAKVAELLNIAQDQFTDFRLVRKAVDARNKRQIYFDCVVEFKHPDEPKLLHVKKPPRGIRIKPSSSFTYCIRKDASRSFTKRPVIVGTGPCGLFCGLILAESGLKPILLERGKPVDERIRDVNRFQNCGTLDPESNIQFGEGGAGTFSDGKLYSLINDPKTQWLFDQLIRFGAPSEIAWDARPHIGTDKLRNVVRNIRETLIQHGAEIHFSAKVTAIRTSGSQLEAVQIRQEWLSTDHLILAIGHSARDTYQMLYDQGLHFTQKPFALGVRIEHRRAWIEKAQHGHHRNHPALPSARYKLAAHLPKGRSVYTFCMCPGGFVVPGASEPGHLVTNGMSEYAQNGENSNSALLVNVTPEDYPSAHPLAGIAFQRRWEAAAYALTDTPFHAPVQLVSDFMETRTSREFREVRATYEPGTSFKFLAQCLPEFVTQSLKEALPLLDGKVKGFAHPDAVLTGVETRSSAPVRIFRDDRLESNIHGIFPAGEGAGYAGGIVSAALDGMKVAEKILENV